MLISNYSAGYRRVDALPATLSKTEIARMPSPTIPTTISRKQAREKGLSAYFTGKPCKYGHIAQRKTTNGMCRECWKGIRSYYQRIGRKNKIYRTVQRALRNGTLVREPCERCGSIKNIHAHHEDYSKPLDVMWLCLIHHQERHKELAAATKGEG